MRHISGQMVGSPRTLDHKTPLRHTLGQQSNATLIQWILISPGGENQSTKGSSKTFRVYHILILYPASFQILCFAVYGSRLLNFKAKQMLKFGSARYYHTYADESFNRKVKKWALSRDLALTLRGASGHKLRCGAGVGPLPMADGHVSRLQTSAPRPSGRRF